MRGGEGPREERGTSDRAGGGERASDWASEGARKEFGEGGRARGRARPPQVRCEDAVWSLEDGRFVAAAPPRRRAAAPPRQDVTRTGAHMLRRRRP